MVRTMSLLRALISTARMVRHTPQLSAGLPPDDAVLLDAPDDRLGPALVSAALGEYEQAAKLLATTRESAEWENRDRYVMRLAAFAHGRDAWLTAWLRTAPRDPDALLVKAELAIRRAWESPARAERLRETGPLIDAAPTAIPATRCRGASRSTTLVAPTPRTPPSRRCGNRPYAAPRTTTAAMSRHSSTSRPSGTARTASASTSPSRRRTTRSRARSYARCRYGPPSPNCSAESSPPYRWTVSTPPPTSRSRSPPSTPRAIPGFTEVRNLLVYVLAERGRWNEALEQFRLIGPYATSFPWTCFTDDPLGQFLETRDRARIQVASATPLRGRAERRPPRGHYA